MKCPINQIQVHEKGSGWTHAGLEVSAGGGNELKAWEVRLLEERSWNNRIWYISWQRVRKRQKVERSQ